MKRMLIMLPGSLQSSFVINEFSCIKENFDFVYLLPFDENKQTCQNIEMKYGFKVKNICMNKVKMLFNLKFYQWFFSKDVRKERLKIRQSNNQIKKILYLCFYGMYSLKTDIAITKILNQYQNKECEVYLYSYWLSRGAYCIAKYKKESDVNFKKVISRAHGYDLYEERNELKYLPFRNYINENLDFISFISKNGKDYFCNIYKNNLKSAIKKVNYLGSDNPLELKKKIIDKDTVCIASCSSMINVKRIDLIIDILSQCKTNLFWIHIGNGELEKEMHYRAKNAFQKGNYRFLGFVENTKILETLMHYDVDYFINLSDSEGIPVSIMEAMSIGIPVIGRDVGGISEIISNNFGLLLDKHLGKLEIIEKTEKELEKYFFNIDKYKIKSKMAKKKWNVDFNLEKNLEKFISCFLKNY